MPDPFKSASARATGRRLAKQAENTEPQPSGPPDLAEILASGAARVPVVGQYLSEVVNPPELGRGSELQGSEFEQEVKPYFKDVGKEVSGFTVRDEVPNMDSIDASIEEDYEILPGIKEVPISLMGPIDRFGMFYAKNDIDKTESLKQQIDYNKEISPLVIVFDEEGPYILEGAHRYAALSELGAESFPAKIVVTENAKIPEN